MSNKLISFDFAIKYLLKDKGNYDIIEGFISALLKEQGYAPVKILALLDTESNKEQYSQKKSLADLIVEDEQHHKYIIEIERQEVKNFVHKSCFNTSRLIVDQISSGNDYLDIKKVFHISLLYFKVGESAIYHGKTIIRELETQEKLSIHIKDDKENIFDATEIFPEYIFISIPQFNDKVEKEIDEWLYVMKNEDVKPEFKSPYMRRVAEKLDVLKMTTVMRDEYYNYMKELATYKDAIDTAEQKGIQLGKQEGIQLGKQEGIQLGKQEGIQLGKQEGIQLGKQEGRSEMSVEVTKKMLSQGIDVEVIAKSTGLTTKQIEEIKAEMDKE